jgi:hypothetical protein
MREGLLWDYKLAVCVIDPERLRMDYLIVHITGSYVDFIARKSSKEVRYEPLGILSFLSIPGGR